MNHLMNDPTPFEKTISELQRIYPEFGQNGYCCSYLGVSPSPIPEDEFLVAVKALRAIGVHIGLSKATHSYALKNCIEEMTGKYVSNGAIIAAANYLGFKVVRIKEVKESPNAYIKLSRYQTVR